MYRSGAVLRFDSFILSAAATVIITRFYLAATGYPQIGGRLHIAHVLWGGLLLAIAMTIMMISLGTPSRFWASLVGGVGFGLFIDEIGKFLTKDVDYFFQPAIAIIYGVLLISYLVGREAIGRRRMLAPQVKAVAAQALADQAIGQLSLTRRNRVTALLSELPPDDDVTALLDLLNAPGQQHRRSIEDRMVWLADAAHRVFVASAARRWVRVCVFSLLTVEVVLSVLSVVGSALNIQVDVDGSDPHGWSFRLSIVGTAVQTALIGAGLVLFARGRAILGLRVIRAGLFFALTFTTLMEFDEQAFSALVNVGILIVLLSITGATIAGLQSGEVDDRA